MNAVSRRNRTTEKYYISETTGNICESAQTLPGDCGDSFSGAEVRIIDQLAECDFGAFENKNYKELSDDPDTRHGSTAMESWHFREARVKKNVRYVIWRDFRGQ